LTILVDTQSWLWMATDPARLSTAARAAIEGDDNELLLSAASAWEIAIKCALGKLHLPEDPSTYVPTRMTALRTLPLAIEHGHALRVGHLPPHHRDPFDRLIVAQALEEDVPVLTSDSIFSVYGVKVIDA
jgi:PIN domain nuclease of toxin-antitoxin system